MQSTHAGTDQRALARSIAFAILSALRQWSSVYWFNGVGGCDTLWDRALIEFLLPGGCTFHRGVLLNRIDGPM